MPRRPRQRTNTPLALFATILVVGGVAMVAFVASQSKPAGPTPSVSAPFSSSPTSSSPVLLLVDANGARIVSGEKERKLSWSSDVKLLGQPLSTLSGRLLSDGSIVALDPEFKIADKNRFRSPDGRHEVLAAKARSDGSGAIEVRYGNDSQSIVIRLSNGSPVRSVVPVGWWDDETVAVTGMVTSSRALFAVPLTGSVSRVAFLSDTYEHLFLQNGAAYYVTVTPGEGLEGQDQPPSSLTRVQRNGSVEPLVAYPDLLIDRVVIGENGSLAAHAMSPDGKTANWVDNPLFILENGVTIFQNDLKSPSATSSTAAFLLPRANLDEIFGTK